jgi:O-antigen/teichoic acid export membrane protein
VPSNLAAALSSLFNAYERMEYPAGITTFTTLLKVGLGVLVLLIGWGFVGLAGVSIVTNLATAVILGRLAVRQFFQPRFEFDSGFVRRMVGISYPLMLNHLLQTLFFKVDVTLLQPLKGDTVVGWYSTAYKWIDALLIIPAYFTMAIFPIMSRYAATAQDSLRRAYVLAVRLLVMIGLPIAVLTTFVADELILILGGPEYLPHGAIALRIMIWFLPFSFVNGVTQYVLIALDQQRWITKTFALAAAFNIGANLLLIPRFSYPAAAAITIASEWVLLVPWTWSVQQRLGPLPWPAIVVRPVLAAAGMATALWLLRPASLWIAVPVASLVYLALLVALGTFGAEDRALIRRLLPERLEVGRLKV